MNRRLVPLSDCWIWHRQDAYFESRGARAWNDGEVPHHITGNPWISATYAQFAVAWMQDLLSAGMVNPKRPLYIVEIGCGNGRFGSLFVRKLLKLSSIPELAQITWRYIFTDANDYNLDLLQSHLSLRDFANKGLIDFAKFDLRTSIRLDLRECGLRLESPASEENPWLFVANYVFDGVAQDCFRVQAGTLSEGMVADGEPTAMEDPAEQPRNASVPFTYVPVVMPRYTDEAWNRILERYAGTLDDSVLLFPTSALECLGNLHVLTGGRFVLLSADKGFTSLEALREHRQPVLDVHGSFSLPVDYHAISSVLQDSGGELLSTSHDHSCLALTAAIPGGRQPRYDHLRLAFEEFAEEQGPDDFHVVLRLLCDHAPSMNLEQLLAALRFSRWDHGLFLNFAPALARCLPDASPAERLLLAKALRRVWVFHFPLREQGNVPLTIAMLLLEAGFPQDCLEFLELSKQYYAPNADFVCTETLARLALNESCPNDHV